MSIIHITMGSLLIFILSQLSLLRIPFGHSWSTLLRHTTTTHHHHHRRRRRLTEQLPRIIGHPTQNFWDYRHPIRVSVFSNEGEGDDDIINNDNNNKNSNDDPTSSVTKKELTEVEVVTSTTTGNTTDDDMVTPASTTTTTTTTTTTSKEETLSFLTTLGAMTGRGEFMLSTRHRPSTQQQYRAVQRVVAELEQQYHHHQMITTTTTTTDTPHSIDGTWELIYSTTHAFRQSPFFMAGRAVCTSDDDIQKYHWFCDMHRAALAISQIQSVRQIITTGSSTGNQPQLISEFEVNVGSVPFLSDLTPWRYSGGLPISITGTIVSTADLTWNSATNVWEIHMDTVQIQGSNLPLVRNLLDNENVKLQSRVLSRALEQTISSYQTPKATFRTTYLDEQFRISRDVDDHIFLHVKTSNSTVPTDYQWVDADLGVGRLLEGLNDAVTKLYI